jgi:hypothetical protein
LKRLVSIANGTEEPGVMRSVHVFTYTLLTSIIIFLLGWINQPYIKDQWNWYTIERPFAVSEYLALRPYPGGGAGFKATDELS